MKLLKLISKLFKKTAEVKMSTEAPNYLLIAEKELGVKEIEGSKHNSRIIQYHSATQLKATADEISWCAAFVNWCLRESGELGTMQANARSFLEWGQKVDEPQLGDIVVFWRVKKSSWQGHVAFFIEEKENNILCLGGNQADQVCYKWYPKTQLLGYRRLQ
jgi:uncharacterized protein (TIGR02594 family)